MSELKNKQLHNTGCNLLTLSLQGLWISVDELTNAIDCFVKTDDMNYFKPVTELQEIMTNLSHNIFLLTELKEEMKEKNV